MKVHCKTNLDLENKHWPTELPEVPRVGDRIQSATIWRHGFQLELEVVAITWKPEKAGGFAPRKWIPHIELHMTKMQKKLSVSKEAQEIGACDGGLIAFYEWYAPLVGKNVYAFI